ncbi:hypothetical protein FRC01_005764 [Tulasnella sp. 417]|nr:hypothetical protein FRC01_005764 [Tulasnella sp. 417]
MILNWTDEVLRRTSVSPPPTIQRGLAMADSSNSLTRLAEFKALYRTLISDSPTIEQRRTTHTHPYIPPKLPPLDIHKPVQLAHGPDIPSCLIDGLDRFADGLQESELDSANLAEARIELERRWAAIAVIDTEVSALLGFASTIVNPIYFLCQALGFNVRYTGASNFLNIIPDHAWTIDKQEIAIFAHKSPSVADHHFEEIVSLAKERQTLDLSKSLIGAESII